MPFRNAHNTKNNQEEPSAPRFDIDTPKGLERFVNLFGAMAMSLESPQVGERHAAGDRSVPFLKSHGLRWIDIIQGWAKYRGLADSTHTALLSQIAAQQAEIDQLRAERAADTSMALWNTVEAKVDDHRIVAQWALGLGANGRVWLAAFEVDFLTTCARWSGSLTAKQKPVYLQIIDRVAAKTGLRPPTS